MENLTSQASVKTNKRNNHQWTPVEDKILIECCLEFVNQGWRVDNGFKTGYLSQLQKWMAKKTPNYKIMGDPHIKSGMRTLKSQFRELKEMRRQSGFGWDDANKCVTCEDDVCHKEAVGLRNKQFLYFDKLEIIFGKDHTTGNGVEFTSEFVEALERENLTFTATKEASEAHEAMKNMVEYDYFGVDIELENECLHL
ncbi:uncharacterized protein LOC120284001 [Dioscorea cayenensis subsp. rotundata]|uniref:Uncharacterized protein LOC120284001 n=1 Tax=Dioscorea cayennensis subsp. rotundata TaxID=55577 RepID=A0AB40D8Q8_DIOCR|nr:uncharacterized protein LOC120284001 [Dioscorea cayenensis subsp. rotundata]